MISMKTIFALNKNSENQFRLIKSLLFDIQVWSGNEDCEPVTWNECKLVEYDVPFKVPAIVCEDAEFIPWNDCEETYKSQMTSKMTCKPSGAVECTPIHARRCTTGKLIFTNEILIYLKKIC